MLTMVVLIAFLTVAPNIGLKWYSGENHWTKPEIWSAVFGINMSVAMIDGILVVIARLAEEWLPLI